MRRDVTAVAARLLLSGLLVWVAGCASYATPGGPAGLSPIIDAGVREGFAAEPEAIVRAAAALRNTEHA